ncbi:hypothetical protein D3C72_2049340 [compost metagenome]
MVATLEPKELRPVVAAVATPVSCPTLTASVTALPAARFVILRSAPADPSDTSPLEFCAVDRPIAV